MYNFIYLTLFPAIFKTYFGTSIPSKAIAKKCFNYHLYNIRDWAIRGQVDDYLYGGGSGMVLKIYCLVKSLAAVYESYPKNYIVLLSPQGKRFTQVDVARLIEKKNLVFICGHYEGIDARIEAYVDEKISVGDFINSGGELPSLTITDALIRALPGVISPEAYSNETSVSENRFDFDPYTRPSSFEGQDVPDVLWSGNHRKIEEWRELNSLEKASKSKKIVNGEKLIPNADRWRLSPIFDIKNE